MKVAIIEDEPFAATRLEGLLRECSAFNIEIVGKAESIAEVLDEYSAWNADILLCDIRLADGLSFNIWKEIEVNIPVIFTTAYEEYALQAFKVNSIDYLLKPIQLPELEQALLAFEKTRAVNTSTPTLSLDVIAQVMEAMQKPNYRSRLMSKVGTKLVPLDTDQISFIQSIDRISWAYDASGGRYPLSETMDELEKVLNPKAFKRLNRAVIANASSIEQLSSYSNSRYRAHLKGHQGEAIIIARDRVGAIKKWLSGEV